MSKRRERELRFAAVWREVLKKEAIWNVNCREGGFISIPPLNAIISCYSGLLEPMAVTGTLFSETEAPKMLKFLEDGGYITVHRGGDRNSVMKGFNIEKRNPLPVTPEREGKAKAPVVPTITVDDLRRVVSELNQTTAAQVIKKLEAQVPELRALISPRVRGRPNIVVLIDTANFGISCDKLNVKMPIRSLFDELAKIGNVISSWAFYNDSNCPEYVKKVFASFRSHLVACLDNKNRSEPEQKTTDPDGKTTIIYKAQTDWIDAEMERFAQDHLQFLDFDIAVFVSGDKHFEPVQNKVRQFGRQVMRCTIENKQVCLWNDGGLVSTLRTERR